MSLWVSAWDCRKPQYELIQQSRHLDCRPLFWLHRTVLAVVEPVSMTLDEVAIEGTLLIGSHTNKDLGGFATDIMLAGPVWLPVTRYTPKHPRL